MIAGNPVVAHPEAFQNLQQQAVFKTIGAGKKIIIFCLTSSGPAGFIANLHVLITAIARQVRP